MSWFWVIAALALSALLLGMIALADPRLLGRWFGMSQSRSPPGDDKQGTGLTVTGTVKWFSNAKGYGFITPPTAAPTCSSTTVASLALAAARR